MSVDERLREAFDPQDQDHDWVAVTPAALHRVRTRHRRTLLARRGTAVGLAGAATVAAILLASQPDERAAPAPVTPVSPSTNLSEVLDGQWRSDPVGEADVRATLDDAGLTAYADEALAELPPVPFRIVLSLDGDALDLDLVSETGTERFDEETASVHQRRLVLYPRQGDGRSLHRWAIEGGELRMQFVATDEEAVDGVPAEVWQRILYDTAAFRR